MSRSFISRLLASASAKPEENTDVPETGHAFPVHITGEGARLCVRRGMLHVESDGQERDIPVPELSMVAIHGAASISTPCIATLAEAGVPILFLSRAGYYQAQLVSLAAQPTRRRRAQYETVSEARIRLRIARAIVTAKLTSAHATIRRRLGGDDPRARAILAAIRKAQRARSNDTLMGIEGAAASAYFSAWPELLQDERTAVAFAGRSRRPPMDPVNALLSYLYAVATGHCAVAALAAGLDPAVGFLHAEHPGRPALALDLVEPVRTGVVDPGVIAAVNTGRFTAEHVEAHEGGGVRLTADGRRVALAIFESRMARTAALGNDRMTWRDAISRSTDMLAASLPHRGTDFPVPILP